jgi:hypothetical protein
MSSCGHGSINKEGGLVTNAMRRFYEARVLIVPHGPSALAAEAAMRTLGLDGVMTVHPPAAGLPGLRLRPLADGGWTGSAAVDRVGDAVTGADIVVQLAADLAEVNATLCHDAAGAARESGALISALVIGQGAAGTAAGNTAMAALRAAVDMLVIVRRPELAASFLDVLRGGRRETAMA